MAHVATVGQPTAERAGHPAPPTRRRGGLERRKARTGLLLATPAFVFVTIFVLIPVGFAVYLSFTDYPLIGPDHWTGLKNWASVGQDATFVHSVLFTLEYTAIVTPAIFLVGYGLAVLIRRRRRGSTLLRTLFFLPYVVGLVTESFLLLLELQPGSGGVNAVLHGLHITNGQTAWLVHTNLALIAVSILVVWFASGLTMVLLMAGTIDILHYVGNSLIVAVGTAILTAVLATIAGYGFGRFTFRGRGIMFAVTLLALMVPYQAILTPAFLELNFLHLTNSLLGLVFFYSTFNLPFGVFVMRNTFSQIPAELEESARVDGAGTFTTLWRVMRPLVAPGIATTVLYAFLFAWTEFLAALTFLTQQGKYTFPVALLNVETGTFGQVNYGYLVAGAVIAMVPCVVLYLTLQRYYVQGLTSGAVKG